MLEKYLDEDGNWWEAKLRRKRAITNTDAQLILDLHNKLRGQVYPHASNMEYMVGALGRYRLLLDCNSMMTFSKNTKVLAESQDFQKDLK